MPARLHGGRGRRDRGAADALIPDQQTCSVGIAAWDPITRASSPDASARPALYRAKGGRAEPGRHPSLRAYSPPTAMIVRRA